MLYECICRFWLPLLCELICDIYVHKIMQKMRVAWGPDTASVRSVSLALPLTERYPSSVWMLAFVIVVVIILGVDSPLVMHSAHNAWHMYLPRISCFHSKKPSISVLITLILALVLLGMGLKPHFVVSATANSQILLSLSMLPVLVPDIDVILSLNCALVFRLISVYTTTLTVSPTEIESVWIN